MNDEEDRVLIEAVTRKHGNQKVAVVATMCESLKTFTSSDFKEKMIRFGHNLSFIILSCDNQNEKNFEDAALRPMEDKTFATPIDDSSSHNYALTLPSSEDQLAWFLHAGYYYEKTKDVYNYTTSFRGVATLAKIGETSANFILKRVSGLDIEAIDHTIAPALRFLDNKVCSSIHIFGNFV